VAVATWAERTPFGGSRTEAKVVHPVVMARLARGPLRLDATLNLEAATMRSGELAPGVWGEGFNDRRHPHTVWHELVVSLGTRRWSVSGGKGFVPFGSDDPMSRPVLRYPVNHHWSQVLERAVAAVGIRVGPAALEAALFNGDEPERPGQWPAWDRFGDSWAARLTLFPARGFEAQVSTADVASPEHRPGAGPEHRKWSGSLRAEAPLGRSRLTSLVEWGRDAELDGFFTYHTALAEAAIERGTGRAWVRLERTERPEEERVFGDPFRSVRPHLDNSILGISRWSTATVGAARAWTWRRAVRLEPLLEVTYARVTNVTGVVQTPQTLFGRNHLWTASVALRIGAGAPMHRMGRYGVVADLHRHSLE
jgi:hypothetical protein